MKKNGFTLVEILAVLIVIGLLVAISIPAYQGVFLNAKRDNYDAKISEIEVAANKYGELTKDDIKKVGCKSVTIDELIQNGYILSEEEATNVIYNPVDNKPMTGTVQTCYCPNTYEIKSFYATTFNPDSSYDRGDKVMVGTSVYKAKVNYNPASIASSSRGIDATYQDDDKVTRRYFVKVEC